MTHYRLTGLVLLCSLWLVGCQSGGGISPESPAKPALIHQDSTIFFADKKASVSMRASFRHEQEGAKQTLAEGYKLQFRSVVARNIFIDQVSIIAGGKKISINEEGFLLPPGKGITLSLSLEQTQAIAAQADALLRFKYDEQSRLISLKTHRLQEFSPVF